MRSVVWYSIVSIVLSFLVTSGFAQVKNDFYKNKNYYSLAIGFMFDLPTLSNNNSNFEIDREFSMNTILAFNWHHLLDKHFGILLKFERLEQTTRYSFKDSTGATHTIESWESSTGLTSLNLSMSYNFMAMKKLNLLVSMGPQLHMIHPYKSFGESGIDSVVSYNVGRLGLGFNVGLNIIYKLTDRLFVFVNPYYQKGFIKFRESVVGQVNPNSVLGYYGSGPGIQFGITFRSKNYPPEEIEGEEDE